MHPRVVHNKVSKYDVLAARPHRWGNEFIIGKDGERPEVILKHKTSILLRPYLVDACRAELKGLVLGCWCAPKDCHCDFLAWLSDTVPVGHSNEACSCSRSSEYTTLCYRCQGLFVCRYCGGVEGAITSECPRERIKGDGIDRIYAGELNYIAGQWIHGSISERTGKNDMPCWCGTIHHEKEVA